MRYRALLILTCCITFDTAQASQADASRFEGRLVAAAVARTKRLVVYDPSYVPLKYPGGDVPEGRGVCSDVIIRSYRAVGIDLQRRVHEDMRARFSAYPKRWGLSRPDRNIDHRRVPNLRRYFTRHGDRLAISANAGDYRPGDIVTWDLSEPFNRTVPSKAGKRRPLQFAGKPHIGIVTNQMSADGKRPLIVHNIGFGTVLEDALFGYKITGHYRYRE